MTRCVPRCMGQRMELCSKEGSLLSMYEMEAQLAAIKKDALDRSPDPVEVRCRQQCTESAICVRLCVVVCLFQHMIVPPNRCTDG